MERGSAAHFALDPNSPAHDLDQPGRDRQPQTGAAESARGGSVGLGEGLEHFRLLLARDSHARIGDRDAEVCVTVGRRGSRFRLGRHFHDDFAPLGELDGVANEVDDHLPEPAWIADQPVGNLGRHAAGQFEPFVGRPDGEHLHRPADALLETELNRLHLKLAGLDLGKVEDVVQAAARAPGPIAGSGRDTRADPTEVACRRVTPPCR